MRNKWLITIVVAGLLLGVVSLACAVGQPMEIKAETIDYDAASGIITASSGIVMTTGNVTITGREASHNVKSQQTVVRGDARIVRDGAVLTAPEIRADAEGNITATGGQVLLVQQDNQLSAPHIDYNSAKNYAVAAQGGQMAMPDARLAADRLEAFFAENKVVAIGNVRITGDSRGGLDAIADHAIYHAAAGQQPGKMVLTGNVRAVQGNNTLTGNTLTIYLDDKAVDAQGRAKLVVKPGT